MYIAHVSMVYFVQCLHVHADTQIKNRDSIILYQCRYILLLDDIAISGAIITNIDLWILKIVVADWEVPQIHQSPHSED